MSVLVSPVTFGVAAFLWGTGAALTLVSYAYFVVGIITMVYTATSSS